MYKLYNKVYNSNKNNSNIIIDHVHNKKLILGDIFNV